ncbi:hypothetical protein [Streptomyces halobius]|uniref:Uncharacterized protein n=1 Tax=Streptomyces halobius TaxID=2879846 RepID=A0ABY4M5H9_9ACTN|nr:hypothetical protein [Streptomyces halobius]UQA91615.1 hypothetical protein K9S39_06865 [Streptomyces halobius]
MDTLKDWANIAVAFAIAFPALTIAIIAVAGGKSEDAKMVERVIKDRAERPERERIAAQQVKQARLAVKEQEQAARRPALRLSIEERHRARRC